MEKKLLFALLILSVAVFHSCKSYKDITYVQGLASGDTLSLAEKYVTTINTNDALLITVSATNPEAVVAYNPPVTNTLKPGETLLTSNPTLQNYLLDPDGCIDFPSLDRTKVTGLPRYKL